MYIIPRVFVLCSPRTVQFHYELILRVGLPSYEFNPDKHDIDITVHGQQKNEVVPMTRINTRTLNDEPLITSLSIIVYRLVEMPPLGHLVLRHSGPFRAWLYVYDFTVIDLSTNKEQYHTLNQYIGSLNRNYHLEDSITNVHYPIDDVPLPQWTTEDIYLILFSIVNCIALSVALLPINCSYLNDIASISLATLNGLFTVFFLEWLLYYYARWNQERREYFNYEEGRCWPLESLVKIIIILAATSVGACAIYYTISINDWRESLVWMLATSNTFILVVGIWSITRQMELGEAVVSLGLRMRGVESEYVGMKYSELISDMRTRSVSTSDDGGSSMSISNSRLNQSFGPRSSVKSFGFDPVTGSPSRTFLSKVALSRLSNTGATPNNHPRFNSSRSAPGQRPTAVSMVKNVQSKPGSHIGPKSSHSRGSKGSKGSAGKENSASKEMSKKLANPRSPILSAHSASSSSSSSSHQTAKQVAKEPASKHAKDIKEAAPKQLLKDHKQTKEIVPPVDHKDHKEHPEGTPDISKDKSNVLQKHL